MATEADDRWQVLDQRSVHLVLEPSTLRGEVASVTEPDQRWAFDPLAHLAFSDPDGVSIAWDLRGVERRDGPIVGVQADVQANRNRYHLTIGIARDTGHMTFAIEPIDEPDPVGDIAFPGPIVPLDPSSRMSSIALPLIRTNGVLSTPAWDDEWSTTVDIATHSGLNMPFWGAACASHGMIAIVDTPDDAQLTIVKSAAAPVRVEPVWKPSLGRLRARRTMRMFPLDDPSYVTMAHRYRRDVQQRGAFRSLADKIAERPIVQQLVGGPYFSMGYLPLSERKFRQVVNGLREIGYTSGIIGPIDHIQWGSGEWLNDYQPFIHAPEFAPIAREAGFAAFCWLYLEDILRWDPWYDPSWLVVKETGEPVEGWFNRDYEYAQLCSRVLLQQHRHLRDRMTQFDALHFDTTTAKDLIECWSPDHPMTRSDDRLARTARLEEVAGWGMLIGAEAGYDWAFGAMDFCSNNPRADLSIPLPGTWQHIPLLGLVYHDSIVSYCWEYDPYNPSYLGGDWSRQKILFDAMCGNPPTVAPVFGYFPVIRRPYPPVESRWVMWEDPETQRLLREALPIAQLHARTALHAMADHQQLTSDGLVTRTVFADGTAVDVNRGSVAWEGDGEPLAPLAYRPVG